MTSDDEHEQMLRDVLYMRGRLDQIEAANLAVEKMLRQVGQLLEILHRDTIDDGFHDCSADCTIAALIAGIVKVTSK